MTRTQRFMTALSCVLILLFCTAFAESASGDYTDVAILSTTDMHGKCWPKNILTGYDENNNMLRVSTAVSEIRDAFGPENVILIDNGDLFQGTPISQIQLSRYAAGESDEPLAMALCLKEIGYDAFVLGNHEFNFAWSCMKDAYGYLEENGVSVLAANAVYDGSVEGQTRGENAFTPYIVRTVTVSGHEHKIGILGFENCDITRWDLPVNYPGLMFVHPENDGFSMAREAALYLDEMRQEGCEFIIVAYHGGEGDMDTELKFGINTESQGMRIAAENEGIDLLILGHDHTAGYSNTFLSDLSGRDVPVVNGGGQTMTRTVFRFSEDDAGRLTWELLDSANLNLSDYGADASLEEKIRPYADMAEEAVSVPVGTATGEWDKSKEFYTRQTDSIDLVSAAMMAAVTDALTAKFGEEGLAALESAAGLDHLDADLSLTSVTSSGYTIWPGDISMKDLYRLYRYDNVILALPLYGRDIRAIMEENASNRLAARVIGGKAYFYNRNDQFTNLIFGGINFTYDMSKPEGERVVIDGFSNGRPFEEDRLYVAAVNNYLLGNERCGLRYWTDDNCIWSQLDDGSSETIQNILADYIRRQCEENGSLTPDTFTWRWDISYSADPADLPPWDGDIAASYVPAPKVGKEYVLFHEAQSYVLTARPSNGGLAAVSCGAWGETLTAPLPDEAEIFTVLDGDDGALCLADRQGLYLTGIENGGLSLTDERDPDGFSDWTLQAVDGGYLLVNNGSGQALEYYSGRFTTYQPAVSGLYIFNFYEMADPNS